MAVDFAVDILTSAGEQKIAQATAGNRLVYTRILSSTSAYEAAAASSLAPGDLAGPAGAVKSASATDDRARVVGAISSADGPATLKTFALCGRLESDTEDAVIVVKSDPGIAVPLPGPESPSTAIEIDFVMEISAASSVTVQITGPGSVTMADLGRFVSIHKAGDTEAGETQSILGLKRFMDACQASEFRVAIPGHLGAVAWIAGDWEGDANRARVDFKLRTPGAGDPATVMQLNTRYGNPDVHFPGDVAIGGDFSVLNTGAAAFDGNATFNGVATFNGTLTINDPMVATEYISVDGAIYLKDTTHTARSGEIAFYGDADDEYTSLRFYVEGVNDTDALELTRDLSDDSLLAEIWGKINAHGDISTTGDILAPSGTVSAETLSGVLASLYGGGAGALVVLSLSISDASGATGNKSFGRGDPVYHNMEITTPVGTAHLSVSTADLTMTMAARFRLLHAVSVPYSGASQTIYAICTSN